MTRATLPPEERQRFDAASPLRRPRASLGPRPAAPSMRPRPSSPTLEELQRIRSAERQMSVELNEQSLYSLLGVEPSCTDEELKRAYRVALTRFHPEGVATYGLYSRAQAIAITDQIEEAYLQLSDPTQRKSYDAEAFPLGVPNSAATPAPESPVNRFAPLIPPEASQEALKQPLTGALLKSLREAHHITLEQLHERTKISLKNLNFIESEDAHNLPADVYLKGYLQQLARIFGLPETRLCTELLAEVHARRGQR